MKLFSRKSKAVKKWRSRAWSIDPNKTNLTIVVKKEKLSQHIPPWTYKKWLSSQITQKKEKPQTAQSHGAVSGDAASHKIVGSIDTTIIFAPLQGKTRAGSSAFSSIPFTNEVNDKLRKKILEFIESDDHNKLKKIRFKKSKKEYVELPARYAKKLNRHAKILAEEIDLYCRKDIKK